MKSREELSREATVKGAKLQSLLEKVVDHKKVFGTSFSIRYKDFSWTGASGNLTERTSFFIASTTKLYLTAVVLHFVWKGLLRLDDPIHKYLDLEIMNGLHVLKGKDHSHEITVEHLLAHTSGIPDYFQRKPTSGERSLEQELMQGNDKGWTPREAVIRSKAMKPLFVPGEKGRAHYADTNFQLLGLIIENFRGEAIDKVFNTIIYAPLQLSKTYLYHDITDITPHGLYYKRKVLNIPKAMASFAADGGIVTTSKELLLFLEAFFNGWFFPKETIDTLKVWNKIFPPMQSGVGIHRFKLPWFFDPTGAIPELVGHSGLSGALAYHSPENGLYVAGTVNQIAYPDTSFRLAIQLIRETLK